MPYEKREGDIAVFQQTDKSSDRAPDWKGDALIDGKTYEIALWNKGGKGTMLAGQIKVKDETFQRGGGSGVRASGPTGVSGGQREPAQELDDEIPFVTSDSIW